MGLPTRSCLSASFGVLLGLALLTLSLAACTEDGDPPAGAEESPQTSPPPVTSTDSYVFTDAAGIEARLTIDGEGAMLTVENDTGAALPRPGVYVLDARDGARVDWIVVDPASAPEGESEWQVERAAVPEPKHIGLVVLLFGGEDYGAFVPPQPGAAA
ncbi:MAG TPA: hypothetical protein VFI59_14015 [Actinomycetota bacterium]|nr:hypothetical protein [Actinomycetota bacterium]